MTQWNVSYTGLETKPAGREKTRNRGKKSTYLRIPSKYNRISVRPILGIYLSIIRSVRDQVVSNSYPYPIII